MNITTLIEPDHEARVAITPASVKHLIALGFTVTCEHDAGQAAGFSDLAYEQAGALIMNKRKKLLAQTQVLVCVNAPHPKTLTGLQPHSLLIAPIDNEPPNELLNWCCQHLITAFSMNHIPRISRAQNLDSLSSQASLAGYRAVIEAIAHFKRAIPMMMTAAGMIQPAKVLILGAGVAGLQAIATVKRMGAVVYAFDV
ncbi:MAG: NAD(P)(+) transhydrogenase (Re/Si-specific) subunit alpha, partial [Legionellales bacterium]|nr:NAD(P)(+) transhydrogenase (Re/Si-specific) subunit alpha [Legionellales bacterium]